VKSVGGLFGKVIDFQNLLDASRKARIGKRFKRDVLAFEFGLERELLKLQDELAAGSYVHGPYRRFTIHDGKSREISAAPYRDRVLHHALCAVLEPVLEPAFYFHSYACRKGKGTHKALLVASRYARDSRYVLKCDIVKFYPSVDHGVLKGMLARKIRDHEVRRLCGLIIDSWCAAGPVAYFPGDDLFTPLGRARGLPIGNLTSQFFANLYLSGMDHFIKEKIGCRKYLRYMDDFLVFGDDKLALGEVRARITGYLETLRLKLHEGKSRVYRCDDGPGFLGFRIFPRFRLLARGNAGRARRRFRKMRDSYSRGLLAPAEVTRSVGSWVAHAVWGNTFRLRRKILAESTFARGERAGKSASCAGARGTTTTTTCGRATGTTTTRPTATTISAVAAPERPN
jgi:retron-type reverse transcriptase